MRGELNWAFQRNLESASRWSLSRPWEKWISVLVKATLCNMMRSRKSSSLQCQDKCATVHYSGLRHWAVSALLCWFRRLDWQVLKLIWHLCVSGSLSLSVSPFFSMWVCAVLVLFELWTVKSLHQMDTVLVTLLRNWGRKGEQQGWWQHKFYHVKCLCR